MGGYLIVYHKEDNDGLVSMSIIYNYLRSKGVSQDEIAIKGVNYNDLSTASKNGDFDKFLHYDHLYMTDISFNESDKMLELYNHYGCDMTWFDHHAPIIKESERLGFDKCDGKRATNHSALYLVYEYFHYDEEIPDLLKILSAWDSFTFKENGYDLETVRSINTAFTIESQLNPSKTIKLVQNINNLSVKKFKNMGDIILNADDIRNRMLIESSGDGDFIVGDGRKAMALFVQGATNSVMFKSVAETHDNGIVFKYMPNGNWVVSIYNTNESDTFHCGEYCKKNYGGGGHVGAAGCTISTDKFIEIIKNKKF